VGDRAEPGLPAGALAAVIAAIDAANAEDPNLVEVRGRRGPKELLHAQRMTDWLLELCPDADAAQQVAARAHHLRRWEHPRDAQPPGRSGYLRWRTAAKAAHAEAVAGILTAHGADEALVSRVGSIVRKEGLGSDPAVQVHEDALCLVFLETQLDDVVAALGEDKATEVLRRTVGKMSPAGLAASRRVELGGTGRRVLAAALDAAGVHDAQ
jgi:hypothetical protein